MLAQLGLGLLMALAWTAAFLWIVARLLERPLGQWRGAVAAAVLSVLIHFVLLRLAGVPPVVMDLLLPSHLLLVPLVLLLAFARHRTLKNRETLAPNDPPP